MTESNQNKNNTFDSLNYSSVITVRLPDFIKKEIQQDSISNHITVNANVAKILIQHIEWSQFVQESGFVYINRTFLKELLKSIDIKHVENISKEYCVENLKTSIMFIHGEINKNTFIKTLESWLRTSYIPFRIIEKKDIIHYAIQHGLGSNGLYTWQKSSEL